MKTTIILSITGLIMFPIIALAENSDAQVLPVPEIAVPMPTTAATSPSAKCGVNSFAVSNECGLGVYKNVYAQCYDGFETNLGAVESSCKPADLWNQYAKEACANHCSKGAGSATVPTEVTDSQTAWQVAVPPKGIENKPIYTQESKAVTPTIKPAETLRATPVCYISGDLMQQYDRLILELQKSESDKTRAEEITKQIVELKRQIATQQNECVNTAPAPMVSSMTTENKPVAVSTDRCNEVAQWETKITYYKKLSGLSDTNLKKEGFSREEIEKILQELSLGIEKVKTQCGSQEKTHTIPRTAAITGSAAATETVRPVVAESGQEISVYYKAMIEKAVSAKGAEKQIAELKTLRDEIDGLISNLIKSRKELEISELDTLVKEVKVSRGEIKADNISVKTTEKKILVNIGARPVSVEPTESQVLIRDKGLEVNASEVMIKENVLSVGGVDVKMSASEVAEKLNIAPKAVELKEENTKAVYGMKIDERRKLFGVIPFDRERTVTTDAENGNTLSEGLPWYNFMTTK